MTLLAAVELRDYQRQAIDAVHRAFRGEQRGTGSGPVNRAAIVLPTGAGKTVVFTHPDFRGGVLTGERARQRMLVLVHRDELAQQTVAKLHSIDPGASVGRVQAQHDDTDAQIIVGSVQTLARATRRERIRDVGLIVVDEAHHATARTYVEVLEHFGAFATGPFGGTPTAGFSATLARGADDGNLGDVWEEVVLRRDVLDGIREGWLVDVKGKRVQLAGLDLRDVKRSRGDFTDGDLGEHLRSADAPEQVAAAYLELAADRQGVAFWPDVETAKVGAEEMTRAGVPAAVVLGSTSVEERAGIFEAYRRGDLQVLSSCMVLTEGWDMPQASAAVIARPTQSAPLYVQMAGRVLRPWHAPTRFGRKRDALIIDVVGATGSHRLATLADLSVTTKIDPDKVEDGKTLAEAVFEDEVDAAGGLMALVEQRAGSGRRVVFDVELFESSASLWMQTPRGTWFIPAGDWTVFLWPETGGLWTLGVTPTKGAPGQATALAGGLTLDWAMRHAEGYARQVSDALGVSLSSRKASWRKGPASDAQLAFAASLGLRFDGAEGERPRKDVVSDAISVALATRALGG